MHDVVVFEAAHDMGDRIDFAEMTEKLIAEPLPFRGAAHQPRDIDEFELGRDDLRRFGEAGAHRQTLIGYRDPPDIRLARRERIFRRLCRLRRGQRVEQRRFPDIRQADNTAVKTHVSPTPNRHDRA